MKDEIYNEMIKGPDGGISSTRVMAWDTWKFLKILIIVFLAGLTLFGVIIAWFGFETPTDILEHLITIYIFTIIMLFVAIYAPKQFSKMSEVKAMVAASKDIAK